MSSDRVARAYRTARLYVVHHERVVGRLMVFVVAWTALVLPACEEDTPRTSSTSRNGELSASVSSEPEGFDVEQVQVSSFDDLATEVAERGANVLLVLQGAQPIEVHFWGGDDYLHIRTEYVDRRGEEIVIIQAKFDEGDSLTEGKAVSIRGHRGVQADRNWYWRERGWVLSAPADPAIAERLSWLDTS